VIWIHTVTPWVAMPLPVTGTEICPVEEMMCSYMRWKILGATACGRGSLNRSDHRQAVSFRGSLGGVRRTLTRIGATGVPQRGDPGSCITCD
jgi:hypothetical protein